MKLIVGLGNPGREYEKTRHNIGFNVLDLLADKYNITFSENKNRRWNHYGTLEQADANHPNHS